MKRLFSKKVLLFFLLISIFPKINLFIIDENNKKLPVIRLALDSNNIGDLEKIAIAKLLTLREISIGNLSVSEEIQIIGKIDFNLDNAIFKITNTTDVEIFLSFAEKKNINFILNLLEGEITFDYKFESGIMSSSGNGTLYLNNISLLLNNTIIQVPNEYEPEKLGPGLSINSLELLDFIGDFSFSKNGTLEKFIKFFKKNFKNILLKAIENQLNKDVSLSEINSMLYNSLKRIKLNIPINDALNIKENMTLSFSMNEEPIVQNHILEISFEAELKGEYYEYEAINNITLPHLVNHIELLSPKSINSYISQFILNNALDILFFYGKFNFEITNDTIGLSEINLGTIQAIIPEIKNGYETSQKVKILTKAIQSPILKINTNNKLVINLFENLKFFVYNKTEKTEYINEDIGTIPIDADSNIEIEASFVVNDNDIQLTLTSIILLTFEVKNSLVGEIDTERVKTNFKNVISFMLGNINKQINSKIQEIPKPINIQGILLNELFIQSYEDYLKMDLSPILASLIKIFKL